LTITFVVCAVLMMSAAPYQGSKTTKTVKRESPKNATAAQIAAAKAAGLVWVNLSTKVYHASTSEFYGATKSGKFMSEKDAFEVGYKKSDTDKLPTAGRL
jgi:hypothetical protein